MRVAITPSMKHILLRIAEKGPATGYDLYTDRELSLSDKTCYQNAGNLVNLLLLRTEASGKTRTGVDKKFYQLTPIGLAIALLERPTNSGTPLVEDLFIQSVIASWRERILPFVLGKWKLFEEELVLERAYLNLIVASSNIQREYDDWHQKLGVWNQRFRAWKKEGKGKLEINADGSYTFTPFPYAQPQLYFDSFGSQEERFALWFYCQDLISGAPKYTKWLQACRKDPEIRSYIIKHLENFIEGNRSQNQSLERNLHILSDI